MSGGEKLGIGSLRAIDLLPLWDAAGTHSELVKVHKARARDILPFGRA